MANLKNVSIVIPLGPEEDQVTPLLDDLAVLPVETEIILVSCDKVSNSILRRDRVRLISAKQGRACQQNAGAKAAGRKFLWFLHADSRVTPQVIDALEVSLSEDPDALHYFHLKFGEGSPWWMRLNEWGARFRSQVLGVPFGDQGFCLNRDAFDRIGGFPEHAPYGEDHLLVWHARQAGLGLKCTGTALQTSARKYRQQGWCTLTSKYQFLWVKQALPEVFKLVHKKQP